MMLDENWEDHFSPKVLSRGYRYFEDGCVARVRPNSRGWQCEVDGTERYLRIGGANRSSMVMTRTKSPEYSLYFKPYVVIRVL